MERGRDSKPESAATEASRSHRPQTRNGLRGGLQKTGSSVPAKRRDNTYEEDQTIPHALGWRYLKQVSTSIQNPIDKIGALNRILAPEHRT